MTTQSALQGSDSAWRTLFRCCQWTVIGLASIAFLADFFAKSMFVLFFGIIGGLAATGLVVGGIVAWVCQGAERRRWYEPALLLACLFVLVSILSTSWPMKLSFAASTRALERLAEQVAAGQVPSLPTRAGAYLIRAVETRPVSGGVAVCLWTVPPQRQHVGFVRSPAGVTPHVNPWTHRRLGRHWHHFAAD